MLNRLMVNSGFVMRNYKREYRNYGGKPEQIKNRSMRNAARREMEKAGKVHKGGTNDRKNLQVLSRSRNRRKSNKLIRK